MTRDEAVEILNQFVAFLDKAKVAGGVDEIAHRKRFEANRQAEAITTILARLKEYEEIEAAATTVRLANATWLCSGTDPESGRYWLSQADGDFAYKHSDLLSAWAAVKEEK